MREYVVVHSKYKTNGKNWDNCLTFVKPGTYNYYHKGKLVWSEDGSDDLFNFYANGENFNYDYFDILDMFPIYQKYSDSCEKFWR